MTKRERVAKAKRELKAAQRERLSLLRKVERLDRKIRAGQLKLDELGKAAEKKPRETAAVSAMRRTLKSFNKKRERIYLRDVRRKSKLTRKAQDGALLELQRRGEIVLMGLDNPVEITNLDRLAALEVVGHPRHVLYVN